MQSRNEATTRTGGRTRATRELAVKSIEAALIKADPAARPVATAPARRRVPGKLKALDSGIAKCVAQLPAGQRKLVTSHDALGYYAARYGFKVIGAAIPSLSTQAQPSAASTRRLVDQIKAQHVAAIFPRRR